MKLLPRATLKLALVWALLLGVSLRYFVLTSDRVWTGEADRFTWNMRLVTKVCEVVVAPTAGGPWSPFPTQALTREQRIKLYDPMVVWSLTRGLLCARSPEWHVRMACRMAGRKPAELTDPSVNLCQAEYRVLGRNDWILPEPGPVDPEFTLKFKTEKDYGKHEDLLALLRTPSAPGAGDPGANREEEDDEQAQKADSED